MKALTVWTEEELAEEMKRYRDRKAFLQRDFTERIRNINEGIELLKDELARRKSGATDNIDTSLRE